MALIKCNACGGEISDKAKRCVHCHAKVISKEAYEENQKAKQARKESIKKVKKEIKFLFLIGVCVVGAFLLILGIGYFFPAKGSDFTKKYKDYLDYALGENWKVEKTEHSYIFKNFWFHRYTAWTLSYLDSDLQKQTLTIDQDALEKVKNEKEMEDYAFAASIIYRYRVKLNEILEKGEVSKLDQHINILDLYYIYTNEGYYYHPDIVKLIDAKTGLRFQTIDLEALDPSKYYLSLSVLYTSGSDIKAYTINESKKIMEEYGIENAIISTAMVIDGSGNAVPVYCTKQQEEVSCPREDSLGEMNSFFIDKSIYRLVK